MSINQTRRKLRQSIAIALAVLNTTALPAPSIAQAVFDGPECETCLAPLPHLGGPDSYISQRYADQICRSYRNNNGVLQATERIGEMRFGSLRAYYENLYRVTCTDYNFRQASPIFTGIATAPDHDYLRRDVFNTLASISEEPRLLLLNRPQLTTRRTRRTLLDQVLIQKRNAVNAGNQHNVTLLSDYERRIRALGGLRFSEMTAAQLRPYGLPPLESR